MDLKSRFYTIFKSLNPHNHKELAEARFLDALKYYLFIIISCVIIMTLLFIPYIYSLGSNVATSVAHFDNLTVSSEFSLKESFNIITDPVIRFEPAYRNITKEFILITPEMISYKHYFLFGAQRDIPMVETVNVVSSTRAQMLISAGIIFLIPSLFFWSIILSLIYFSVIILLTLILALIIAGILRINISILKILKMCIYASTIFIILELLLLPFFRIFLIPLIAYWILVIIILFLWQDDSFKNRNEEEHPDGFKHHGSKTKEIFGNKDESGFKTKHHVPKQDSYEVDENGNMKGSSKKHHKFDEENEGYVELK